MSQTVKVEFNEISNLLYEALSAQSIEFRERLAKLIADNSDDSVEDTAAALLEAVARAQELP